MPIYEFICQACDHEFEKILSFSDSTIPLCPVCGESQVQRKIGRPAIHFKGSGWYITDSKGNNAANGKNQENGNGTDKSEKSKESSQESTAKESSASTESDASTSE